MTTLTITDANLGSTVQTNGVLEEITLVSCPPGYWEYFTLVDNNDPILPIKVLFNMDVSTSYVGPGSVLSSNMNLEFNNLTVQNIPPGAVFTAEIGGAPVNTVPPAISIVTGTGAVGTIATCNVGTWYPTGDTYTRQWQSGGTNIPGATGTTYTAQESDIGLMITCVVTAINNVGMNIATSNSLGPVTPAIDEETDA